MRRARAAALAGLLAGACVDSSTTECADGRTCPEGTVCADALDRCPLSAQVDACRERADGAACAYADVSTGECAEGVCFAVVCGNRVLQTGETCDDGNRLDGDACSATCSSDEVCGNGLIDVAVGETCDGPIA